MAASAQNTSPHPWVRGATWALGLSVAVVGALASAMYDHDRTAVREKFASLESRIEQSFVDFESKLHRAEATLFADTRANSHNIASAQARIEGHSNTADEWKQRILKNEDEIDDIKYKASARHDPFTGTQGDELRKQIQGNASRLRRLENFLGIAP